MNTSGKLHRKEKEFQVRRTEILAQTEKIFSAKGFHETTMAQIADASGFPSGVSTIFSAGKMNSTPSW
jgi:AcrR family transcriptional regulator